MKNHASSHEICHVTSNSMRGIRIQEDRSFGTILRVLAYDFLWGVRIVFAHDYVREWTRPDAQTSSVCGKGVQRWRVTSPGKDEKYMRGYSVENRTLAVINVYVDHRINHLWPWRDWCSDRAGQKHPLLYLYTDYIRNMPFHNLHSWLPRPKLPRVMSL